MAGVVLFAALHLYSDTYYHLVHLAPHIGEYAKRRVNRTTLVISVVAYLSISLAKLKDAS